MTDIKKILRAAVIAILSLSLMLFLASCDDGEENENEGGENQPCTEHIDADGNMLCDVCSEIIVPPCEHTDSDYDGECDECGEDYVLVVDYRITMKDESGAPLSGVSITLYQNGEICATAKTDADGCVSGRLNAGEYQINAEDLPTWWTSNASFSYIVLNGEHKEYSFTAVDNTPDGTESNPFPAENAETGEGSEVNMPVGASYVFICRGSTRYLVIENTAVKVIYGGVEYTAEDGAVRVLLAATADTTTSTFFTVENISGASTDVKIKFEGIPGTSDNPYAAAIGEQMTAAIPAEGAIYYTLTAEKTGILMVRSDDANNNIMLYNTTRYIVTSYTNGRAAEYLQVAVGDVISITVATQDAAADEISFTLSYVSGSEGDPIPVFGGLSLRVEAGQTLYLSYQRESGNVTVSDSVTVTHNGQALVASRNKYSFSANRDDVIAVTNSSDERVEVEISIK